jgi:alkaline phosphatase D
MRIAQISDTHISREHGQFRDNAKVVRDWIRRQDVDLIVNTGDLSMNGAVTADDLEDAVAWHRDLGRPSLVLPGNHDVGDMPDLRADQILNSERLARYRRVVGADRWIREMNGWRLVGLNGMLFGTGHPDEEEQFGWIETALAGTSPIALFLHKPLFVHDPLEGPCGYWTIKPEPRARLLALLAKADIRLIASGHLHVARQAVFAGVPHVWCPSSAFVCGPTQGDEIPGDRRIGAVIHAFGLNDVRSDIVFMEDAQDLQIDPHLPVIYPKPESARVPA